MASTTCEFGFLTGAVPKNELITDSGRQLLLLSRLYCVAWRWHPFWEDGVHIRDLIDFESV